MGGRKPAGNQSKGVFESDTEWKGLVNGEKRTEDGGMEKCGEGSVRRMGMGDVGECGL